MISDYSDRKRVFQIAGWIWLAYLLSLFVVDLVIYSNQPVSPSPSYYLVNFIPAIIFLALSYSNWLSSRWNIFSPLLILVITLTPILVVPLFNIHLPPAPLSNLEGMILRQLPVLFIALALVAWNYNLTAIILYSLAVNLGEVGIVYAFGFSEQIRQPDFFFIIVVRTVCFIVVGIFINQLINLLRKQHASLQVANKQLAHYASTFENLTLSRERNRMSRELHDTVVHTLSGLSVQLETIKAYWDVEPETAKSILDSSLEATRTGLQETRRAIKALRASPLDDLGLQGAIQNLLDYAAQRGNLVIESSFPVGDLFLPPNVEQALYRIIQEAIENIIQHARATKLIFHLKNLDKDIDLVIQDDGIGFNPQVNSLAGHFGLTGMQERAKLVGGELTINSQPQQGTNIHLTIKGCLQ
ncbi:MAG: hypothetical protein C3F13_14285 [Anaerolineales bacterium]|nr:sensor histidine kinase [Anaerolineae bacterium]PWB51599.1 MAG: hypothetical protein C3F13_14285 [Anaerolineales bacterium]